MKIYKYRRKRREDEADLFMYVGLRSVYHSKDSN